MNNWISNSTHVDMDDILGVEVSYVDMVDFWACGGPMEYSREGYGQPVCQKDLHCFVPFCISHRHPILKLFVTTIIVVRKYIGIVCRIVVIETIDIILCYNDISKLDKTQSTQVSKRFHNSTNGIELTWLTMTWESNIWWDCPPRSIRVHLFTYCNRNFMEL